MSMLTKLNTLLRAGARENAERVTDANAIRIYRQEIVDAENLLERRRLALAGLIATRRDLEREIASAGQRIDRRERQVAGIDPRDRSQELLLLAARDIAATESHVVNLTQRQVGLVQRIDNEELTLRKLVAEIREHRREVGILNAEVARNGRTRCSHYAGTVAAHLATLRETRAGIGANVSGCDVAEESFSEAADRIDGDPLDRALAAQGRDPASLQLASVLERLKGMPGAEARNP